LAEREPFAETAPENAEARTYGGVRTLVCSVYRCMLKHNHCYNTIRMHAALNYRPSAPQTMNPFLTPLDQAAQMQ
jgi:hypothetical protein